MASLVNPFIGTGAGGAVVGQVDTFPGADAPFGMLQWSPDTPSRPDGGGYNYADNSTLGFSLTHISGPGCAAAGDVPFLPTTGAIGSDPQDATESFSHTQEHASPGSYEAELGSPAINSQIAVNDRSGLGVFTYPATTQANMLIKAGDSANGNDAASVQVAGSNEVTGSSTSGHFCGTQGHYTVYFAAKFDQPFTSSGTWTPSGVNAGAKQAAANGPIKTPKLPTAASPAPGTSRSAAPNTPPAAGSAATEHPAQATGPGPVERKGPQSRLQQPGSSGPATGAWVTFDTTSQPVVKVQVSISYVSVANAEANLSADSPGWDVTALRAKTYSQWQQLLSKFRIGGGTIAQQQTFYTALYHSFVDPALYSDANGQYTGFDNQVHTVAKGQGGEYTDISGWDIYRSEVPLMAIADPAVTGDAMQSLVDEGAQGGWLDKWPLANDYTGVMNGDAADPILAEALAYGVRNFDTSAALAEMIKGATQVPTASELGQGWYSERPNLAAYEQLGYVPNTTATSISPVDNGTSETTETLASVTLPTQVNQGELHIFAIGTSTTAMSGPVLTGVSPSPAPAGQTVTITGSGFGASQGSGYVAFSDLGTNWGGTGNAGETIDSWSDTAITFTVPSASGSAHVWAGSTATVEVVTGSGATSDPGVLEITPTGSMSDYYGNTGISSDASQSCANLDGDGYSFSADALAKAGVTAGGNVTSGGVSFTWPASCQPDNVLAAGQTILLTGKAGATMIGFLGTSTDGATSGPVTITYTDGSTSTATLSFSDWAGTAAQGENTPASIPYRNSGSGTSQSLTISVYEMSLPLTAGQTVASVTLPYVSDNINGNATMHIFSIGEG